MKRLPKILPVLIGLFLLFTLSACTEQTDEAQTTDANEEEDEKNYTDWMSSLPDSLYLSQITIPGSHDSGSYNDSGLNVFALTQTLTLEEQLSIGIRGMDIRLKLTKTGFKIYHGYFDQNIYFSEVEEIFRAFLTAHPTETILMFVKNEGDDDDAFAESFNPLLQDNDLYFTENRNPTLGEVRGKVVFIRRYSCDESIGINARRGWNGDIFDLHNGVTMHVQDNYYSSLWKSLDDKWEDFMTLYSVPCSYDEFYINFSSCYVFARIGILEIPDIKNSAIKINKKIKEEFVLLPSGYYGLIFMDYVDEEMARIVIDKN